jgi:hypothetical protein
VIGVGIGTEQDWLIPVGVGGYVLGGPIVHLAHSRPGTAGISFGLNVGLPFAGGLLGALVLCGLADACDGQLGFLGIIAGFIIGAPVGMVAASVIDVAVLAKEEVPAPTAATTGAALTAWPGPQGAGAVMPVQLGFRF